MFINTFVTRPSIAHGLPSLLTTQHILDLHRGTHRDQLLDVAYPRNGPIPASSFETGRASSVWDAAVDEGEDHVPTQEDDLRVVCAHVHGGVEEFNLDRSRSLGALDCPSVPELGFAVGMGGAKRH